MLAEKVQPLTLYYLQNAALWAKTLIVVIDKILYDNQAQLFCCLKVHCSTYWTVPVIIFKKEKTQDVITTLVGDFWSTPQGYKLESVSCWLPKFSIITD